MTGMVHRALTWLVVAFQLDLTRPVKDFQDLLVSLNEIEVKQGRRGLILYVKETRLCLARFLSGSPIKSNLIRLTGDGIPVILAP